MNRFSSPLSFIIAFSGILCGLLLLWINLTLHFAQIEEILPTLSTESLLKGKTAFLGLILICTIALMALIVRLPWKALFSGVNNRLRVYSSVGIFGFTFIPLFWLRFGAVAWIILLLILLSFFLCGSGILIISHCLTVRFKPPALGISPIWRKSHPWLPAIILLGSTIFFSRICFDHLPHVEDSITQLLQARIFASGHATAEPFTPKEFFYFGFMVDYDRWFAQYPPGHPLILTLGVLAGAPHLINPLLGAIGIILFYQLLKMSDGETFARWGAWAMMLSPYVIFMSSEFMNHTTTLVSSLIGWLALKKAEKGGGKWLFLSGFAFGYCTATRPLEGAIFAFIGGVFILSFAGGLKIRAVKKIFPYIIGYMIAVSLYPLHNALTTGDCFTTGYQLTWGGNGLGLGEVNWGSPHTFGYGLVNTFMSIAGLNVFLYEIPIPALAGIFFWAVLGKKMTGWDRTFLAAMILVPIGYLFYYFHDYCLGPRYYYAIVPQLIYFSIKGVHALHNRIVERLKIPFEVVSRGLIWAGIILLLLQTLAALPNRARIYADAYWGTNDSPMKEAKRLGLKNAVIFIENHPWEDLQTKLHSMGFLMGDAHRWMFSITMEGLDQVLSEMGIDPEEAWGMKVDREELERRMQDWNSNYLLAGNPAVDPWSEEGFYTYYSNGALHLDPRDRNPEILFARDLGTHNFRLLELHPDRKAYRFAYDRESGRFILLPFGG